MNSNNADIEQFLARFGAHNVLNYIQQHHATMYKTQFNHELKKRLDNVKKVNLRLAQKDRVSTSPVKTTASSNKKVQTLFPELEQAYKTFGLPISGYSNSIKEAALVTDCKAAIKLYQKYKKSFLLTAEIIKLVVSIKYLLTYSKPSYKNHAVLTMDTVPLSLHASLKRIGRRGLEMIRTFGIYGLGFLAKYPCHFINSVKANKWKDIMELLGKENDMLKRLRECSFHSQWRKPITCIVNELDLEKIDEAKFLPRDSKEIHTISVDDIKNNDNKEDDNQDNDSYDEFQKACFGFDISASSPAFPASSGLTAAPVPPALLALPTPPTPPAPLDSPAPLASPISLASPALLASPASPTPTGKNMGYVPVHPNVGSGSIPFNTTHDPLLKSVSPMAPTTPVKDEVNSVMYKSKTGSTGLPPFGSTFPIPYAIPGSYSISASYSVPDYYIVPTPSTDKKWNSKKRRRSMTGYINY